MTIIKRFVIELYKGRLHTFFYKNNFIRTRG